jgi:hypothetical protein
VIVCAGRNRLSRATSAELRRARGASHRATPWTLGEETFMSSPSSVRGRFNRRPPAVSAMARRGYVQSGLDRTHPRSRRPSSRTHPHVSHELICIRAASPRPPEQQTSESHVWRRKRPRRRCRVEMTALEPTGPYKRRRIALLRGTVRRQCTVQMRRQRALVRDQKPVRLGVLDGLSEERTGEVTDEPQRPIFLVVQRTVRRCRRTSRGFRPATPGRLQAFGVRGADQPSSAEPVQDRRTCLPATGHARALSPTRPTPRGRRPRHTNTVSTVCPGSRRPSASSARRRPSSNGPSGPRCSAATSAISPPAV